LLRRLQIVRPNHVWASDITYIPMQHGFLYLTAVMDLFSRNVLSWKLSNTLTGDFCIDALDEALSRSRPEIFNTDQGAQFTATAYTSRLENHGVALSMDGRGRALDKVFVERLWRSVKYEEDSLRDCADGWDAEKSLRRYFDYYRNERIHQALGYRTTAEVYAGC
jgi:putative transposase